MSEKAKEEKKIVPDISILHGGDPETGIHIFRAKDGFLEGNVNENDIRELLPVLEAAITELTVFRNEIKTFVDAMNEAEAEINAKEETNLKTQSN